jgi:hypothetical protein
MSTQVEASTIQAGQLFSTNRFTIPDFQRDYSWKTDDDALEFWKDLRDGNSTPPYFLGLLIFTDENGAKTVVDGQQRLITLSLLANAIRKAALRRGRNLVADSMRDVFLFALDYETEQRSARISLTSDTDRASFEALLAEGVDERTASTSNVERVQRFLDKEIEADLKGRDAAALGRWAQFLTSGITFAMFEHPDRNAAYKVYEVVNTRGKDLTPADLIKSYVIGTFDHGNDVDIYRRWIELEKPFIDLGVHNQFTQFIRHVVTLNHGYVIPRDLYQEITRRYESKDGVRRLFDELESFADIYLQMIDPTLDIEQDDDVLRSFAVLDALGLTTVRPIFLAVCRASNRQAGLEKLVKIIVTRIVSGAFGTGSIERKFAEAARAVFEAGAWEEAMETLADLIPARSDFAREAKERQSKGVLHVLRNSIVQSSALPSLEGYLHFVRPRNADQWPDFDDAAYRAVGQTIGNAFLSTEDRRPRGTNTLEGAMKRLLPTAIDHELVREKVLETWSSTDVVEITGELATTSTEIWYAK